MVDNVLKEIMKKINDYTYTAGDVVSEVALAEELSVSRTPVREAILRLIEYGVLERTATKVVVKAITLVDISEILEVREAMESMSVKLIIKKGGLSDKKLDKLIEINKAMSENISQGNFEKVFSLDNSFHDLIIEYGGNSRLMDLRKRLTIQAQRSRSITIVTPTRHVVTVAEHSDIIAALTNNDYPAVRTAITTHIDNSLKNYTEILGDNRLLNIIKELNGSV